MLFLAINKQLDLQSLATAAARCLAKFQGWYQNRASFQLGAIISLGLISVVGGLFFMWTLRRNLRHNFLALLGLVTVLGFVMIRAVGFHFVDVLINVRIGPIGLNWILELSGLILISLNAFILLRQERTDPPKRRWRSSSQRHV